MEGGQTQYLAASPLKNFNIKRPAYEAGLIFFMDNFFTVKGSCLKLFSPQHNRKALTHQARY